MIEKRVSDVVQVLAQIELYSNPESYPLGVHDSPKILDEKVARLHLDAFGVELTEYEAKYLGVDKNGPYKLPHYC